MPTIYSKVSRVRDYLAYFAVRYPQHCYVCGEKIDPVKFLQGDASDGILLHHIEHDRSKNDATDLAVVHRGCHKSYHRNLAERNVDIRTAKAIEVWEPSITKT